MAAALLLLSIAGAIVLAGLIIAIIGFFMKDEGVAPAQSPSFGSLLIDLIKNCFKIMFDRSETRPRKIQALGIFLILVGLGFLLAAGVSALISSLGGSGSVTPTDSPSPSSS